MVHETNRGGKRVSDQVVALELKATSGRQKLTLPDLPQLTDPFLDFGTMHFRTEPRVQSGMSRCARRPA